MELAAVCRVPRGLAWAIGCSTLVVSSACGGAPPEVAVGLSEFAFEPRQIPVQAGQKTVMVLQNKGTQEHDFTVQQLRIAARVAPGRTERVEFAAPPGTYKLVCTMPGHEEAGMTGEVRVARR